MIRPLLPALCLVLAGPHARAEDAPIDLGARLELMVDEFLVDTLEGGAQLTLQKPRDRGVVITLDKPWEGSTSAYLTFFRDGGLYRMYYRGWHHEGKRAAHPSVVCHAESRDGIHWTRPQLDLVEFRGSKANNIIWDGVGNHNFVPFIDTNPACKPAERYKAVGGVPSEGGLFGFVSPDGLRWKLIQPKPILPTKGLDSQNLAFWDAVRGEYRLYYRTNPRGFRSITTATSKNFTDWGPPAQLTYPGAPAEQLYTNQIQPYPRAPHIFIGMPGRFWPKRGSMVEPLFMSSRDGVTFKRWPDTIVPIGDNPDKKGNRCNYAWCGLLETRDGDTRELSFYTNERYYRGEGGRIRRHSYPLDGMVAVSAPASGGGLVTRPFTFAGNRLLANYRCAPGGSIRFQLTAPDGKTNDALDSGPLHGAGTDQPVLQNLANLAGKPARLKVTLSDADFFSFRFAE